MGQKVADVGQGGCHSSQSHLPLRPTWALLYYIFPLLLYLFSTLGRLFLGGPFYISNDATTAVPFPDSPFCPSPSLNHNTRVGPFCLDLFSSCIICGRGTLALSQINTLGGGAHISPKNLKANP